MYRISYRFLVSGWSAKPPVSAHDRIMGTHSHDAAGGLDVLICHDAPEGTTGLVSGLP